MKISIVIPAFNEEKLLGRTLAGVNESLGVLKTRGWETEVVVCDNNSKDRTAAIAEAAGAKVVFEPVNQISRARNSGAAGATGDWLVFIDADSVPSGGLLEAVARNIETGRCIGGGCLVELDEKMFAFGLAVSLWNAISIVNRWAAGSFVYCEAAAFRDIGGFSCRLYASEEIEFSWRLKRLGRRQGRKFWIVRKPKLVTSARKMHLYTPMELIGFFMKATLLPWRVLANREQCGPWYDGRR